MRMIDSISQMFFCFELALISMSKKISKSAIIVNPAINIKEKGVQTLVYMLYINERVTIGRNIRMGVAFINE